MAGKEGQEDRRTGSGGAWNREAELPSKLLVAEKNVSDESGRRISAARCTSVECDT